MRRAGIIDLMDSLTSVPGTTHGPVREYIGAVTLKGMVTIPQEVRRHLQIKPQGQVIFRMMDDKVEIKPMPMTLEETYGSVTPINQPENFKQLRDGAIEEH